MDDDWDILQRFAAKRDQAAFAELARRHVDFVYGCARRMLGGPGQEAEDVSQAVFLLLAQKAGRIRQRGLLAVWLFRTTRYCCQNVRKAEGRRKKHDREASMQRPEAKAAAEDLLPMLDEALEALGRKEREAILARFLECKTISEAATAMGISTAAAEKRLRRGMEKLRRIFTGKGFVVPAAGLGAILAAESAQAAPAGLALTTGGANVGAVSISKGAAAMMRVTLIKSIAAAVLVILVLAVGAKIILTLSLGADATVAVATRGDAASTSNAGGPGALSGPQFSISGELPKVGVYALAPGMKLRAAIELSHYAGNGKGLTAMIVRTVDKERVLLPMDLSKLMDGNDAGRSNVELKDGDLVDVRSTEIPREQIFWVLGEVPRPGGYLPAPAMRLRAALTELAGFKGDGKGLSAFIDHGVNEKPAPPVDLSKALDENDASGSNVAVKNGDIIVVESTEKASEDFRNWRPAPGMDRIADSDSVGRERKVSIQGAVARPGVYDIGDHRITLRQAVFAAGIPMEEARGLAINITNDKIKIAPGGYYYSGLFSNVLDGKGYEYCLQPGDVVKIERATDVPP